MSLGASLRFKAGVSSRGGLHARYGVRFGRWLCSRVVGESLRSYRGGAVRHLGSRGQTLAEQVVVELRNAILHGELEPGSVHSISDLADKLGVSRTPVREAVAQLETQRMVRFERNKGVRIVQMSEHDLEEIFGIRLLLEVPATFRATSLLNEQDLLGLRRQYELMASSAVADDEATLLAHDWSFHGLILEAAGNARLKSFVDDLRMLVLRQGPSTAHGSRTLEEIAEEHNGILLAIESGDAAAAARTMQHHLLHTVELLMQQEFPEFEVTAAGVKSRFAWTTPLLALADL